MIRRGSFRYPARVLLFVPVVLALHNAEEALTIRRAIPLVNARLSELLQAAIAPVTYEQFLVALAVVTLLPLLAVPWVWRDGRFRWGAYALLAVQATMLLNVGSHLTMAWVLGGYAPGLITSVCLVLPFSVYLLGRAIRERWFGRIALAGLAPLALLLHGPLLLGLMVLAGAATEA